MLGALALASRLVLAAVFAVAAVAKLSDREGTRQTVVAFGVGKSLAPALALLLPVAELAVAVLLLPSTTALAGALGALGLLVLFSAAIALNLIRGREPECRCFGQLHSAPAGARTLVRNAGLAGVAAVAVAGTVAGSEPSAVAWIAVASGAVAAALLAAGTMAFLSLLRAHGRVLVRLESVEQALADAGLRVDDRLVGPESGLEPGTRAPAAALDLLRPGLPLLLVFTSPSCGPCRALLPELARWQTEHPDRLTVVVDESEELQRAFEANGTPSAVLIAPDGTVASRVAAGAGRIEALAARILDAPGIPIGAPAPAVGLPSLDGPRVRLTDLHGRAALLLFWNPDCGFCRAMHGDLLAWEESAGEEAPRLVVVSSGGEAKTRADGFRSTVLLDSGFAVGDEFGVGGTPMAVLLGEDGRVASDLATGAEAVLALARSRGAEGEHVLELHRRQPML